MIPLTSSLNHIFKKSVTFAKENLKMKSIVALRILELSFKFSDMLPKSKVCISTALFFF